MTEPVPPGEWADRTRDADPDDGRDETLTERLDRNWIELLQELRVVQTGTQILTGFLLALAFQPRFSTLDDFELAAYLVLVTSAVVATVLGLAPVSLHRALFRRHERSRIVAVANRLLIITLIFIGIVLTGTMLLIFDVVLGRVAGIAAGAATLAVVALAWLVLPRTGVRRRDRPGIEQRDGEQRGGEQRGGEHPGGGRAKE